MNSFPWRPGPGRGGFSFLPSPPPWEPTAISPFALYLPENYNAATGLLTDGSGNGHDLVQATAAKRFSLIAEVEEFGWSQALRATGGQYLSSTEPASTWKFLHDGSGCEIWSILVFRREANSFDVWLSTGDGSPTPTGIGLCLGNYTAAPGPISVAMAGTGSSRWLNDQASVGAGAWLPHVRRFCWSDTGVAPEWENRKYQHPDTLSGNTGSGSPGAAASSNPAYTLTLGAIATGASSAVCDFAAVAIWNRVLSADERALMIEWVARRFAPAIRAPVEWESEVWVCLGDSEMAGRGEYAGYPAQYPPANSHDVLMVHGTIPGFVEGALGNVPISEPTGVGALTKVGAAGFWAWKRQQRAGGRIRIVNAGRGSATSTLWLKANGSQYYENAVLRAKAALRQPRATLGGFVLWDGANDALSASPPWQTNWTATLANLRTDLGAPAAPIYLIRYPATVPTDQAYPSWTTLRATIGAAPFASGIADAPEGPWVEAYKLHLDTAANWIAAQALDGVIP